MCVFVFFFEQQRLLAKVLRGQSLLTERLQVVPELIGHGPRGPEQRRGQSRSAVLRIAAARGPLCAEEGSGVRRPLAPADCK